MLDWEGNETKKRLLDWRIGVFKETSALELEVRETW